MTDVVAERVPYGEVERAWLDRVGKHYLQNAPPGALFAVGVRRAVPGLFGEPVGEGPLLGLCLVGRPVSPKIAQDGSIGEVTRMVLVPGLPHGTASMVLRRVAEIARARGMLALIAYHDRTRHTGCIYRKAGFRRDGVSRHVGRGWATRPGRKSGEYEQTAKRRWRLDLVKMDGPRDSLVADGRDHASPG